MPTEVERIVERNMIFPTDIQDLAGVVEIDNDNEPAPENTPLVENNNNNNQQNSDDVIELQLLHAVKKRNAMMVTGE